MAFRFRREGDRIKNRVHMERFLARCKKHRTASKSIGCDFAALPSRYGYVSVDRGSLVLKFEIRSLQDFKWRVVDWHYQFYMGPKAGNAEGERTRK